MKAPGQSVHITSWPKFAKEVRSKNCNLLKELYKFPNSVLVTGCQRSGTTMLSRVITKSNGMVNYWFGKDDELDAALILSGAVSHEPHGRDCFQTTYLNERYSEYFMQDDDFRIIWVLRNPFSVVYSLLYNWKRFAFNELFRTCGTDFLNWEDRCRYDMFGRMGVGRIKRACMAYNGKVLQLNEIIERIGKARIMVVEYDQLVNNKERQLPEIYDFITLEFKPEYLEYIHAKSTDKARHLSEKQKQVVQKMSVPIYEDAKKHLSLVI